MKNVQRIAVSTIILLLLIGWWNQAPDSSQAQANLIRNPGFEAPYINGLAHDWAPWAQDHGEICGANPEPWDFACRPNWSEEIDWNNLGLTRGGSSQAVGVQYKPWHAGVYQDGISVAPGTRVRFSVWGRAFASNDDLPSVSFGGWNPRLQLGIHPGGINRWDDPGVIWSVEVESLDRWTQLSLEATAGSSGQVSVFVSANYMNLQPLKHLDTWWDEAVLVEVGPAATATSPPRPTNTPGPPPTPRATSTPRPDGAVVHLVQPGDTLYGVAAQYNVPVEQIEQLNAGSIGPNRMLYVGQELVISIPSVPPTAVPPPTSEVPPTPVVTTGSICVLAFHDRNGDTFQSADTEELLLNAVFSLADANGLVGQYTTDGMSEPYCFTSLAPGTYRVTMQVPPGYTSSGASELALILTQADDMDVAFGARRSDGGEDATGSETPSDETTPEDNGDGGPTFSGVLRWVAGISGILVLVAAIVIGVLFVLSRRR